MSSPVLFAGVAAADGLADVVGAGTGRDDAGDDDAGDDEVVVGAEFEAAHAVPVVV